jgi:hypothetical protein
LLFDPQEINNLIDKQGYRAIKAKLAKSLETWMIKTRDPLLQGPVSAPSGSSINDPNDSSPEDPTYRAP